MYLNGLGSIAVMCIQFPRLTINGQPFPGHTADDYDTAIR